MVGRFDMRHPWMQYLYYGLFGLVILAYAIVYPKHNWDAIAYAAATTRFETADQRQAHALAYRDARAYTPETAFVFLTDETPGSYRAQVYEDPDAFAAQLDFYSGRPAYVGAAWVLRQLGLNSLQALHVLSGLSTFMGLLLLAVVAQRHLGAVGFYVLPLLMVPFGLFRVSRLATPDTMSFAAIIVSVWLLLSRQRALLWVLPLLLAVRTDLILWSVPLYAFVWVTRQLPRRAVALSALMSGLLLVILQADHPGLAAVLHMTLLDNVPFSASQPPSLTLHQYWGLVEQGVVAMRSDSACGLFLLVMVASVVAAWRKRQESAFGGVYLLLIAASMAYFVVHFLLFPVIWERFFLGPYAVAAFAMLALLRRESTRKPTTMSF